jgi:membrane dipeptidase
MDRPGRELTAVFDGHNDALGCLQEQGDAPEAFLDGLPERQLDLPRARAGGLAGGLFAIHAPSPDGEIVGDDASWAMELAEPVEHAEAAVFTLGALGRAHALAAASEGAVRIVTGVAELDACRAEGSLGMALHLEGAEAIDADLSGLEAWRAAGVRSIGPVWSRPNAFGHGVPFAFPSSPDTGPGLTAAGRALVRGCAQLGMALDVSHLNAAGFADVARLEAAPIIASHAACHALCASSRNLTDDQLREIAAGEGIIGIVFTPSFVRADGRDELDTALEVLVAHVRHAVEVAGLQYVGLGSDFDGATMPNDLPDVAALPTLLEALSDAGFSAAEIEAIAWGNWRRVLAAAWHS